MSKDFRQEVPEAERKKLLAVANDFADEARRIIAKVSGETLSIEVKADRSLVTQADIEIEKLLRAKVEQLFPDHGVIGEEFAESNPSAEFKWIFDPVDGTDEFVHGVPTFGTVIGLHFRNRPIVGLIDHPALSLRVAGGYGLGVTANGNPLPRLSDGNDRIKGDERVIVSKPKNFLYIGNELATFARFSAEFPRLRVFDSCYAYSNVISGGTDLMFDFNTSIWDVSPCPVLIEELGGKFVSVARRSPDEGDKIRYCSLFGRAAVVERAMHFLPEVS